MVEETPRKSRILVIDDDKNITDLTRIILQTAGYECHIVNSGRDCIKLLQDSKLNGDGNRFDLILLDLAMPGFSGLDVVTKIRDERLFPLGRVVFFTASSSTSLDEVELKKLGVRDCFRKPFKKPDLLNAIKDYVAS